MMKVMSSFYFKALRLLLCMGIPLMVNAQVTNIYTYDQKGRLVTDLSEEIEFIGWNNQDRVTKIIRVPSSKLLDLEFDYDPAGNRRLKIIKPRNGLGLLPENFWEYYYYEYDPLDRLVATYTRKYQELESSFLEIYDHETQMFIPTNVGYQELADSRRRITNQFEANIDSEGNFVDPSQGDLVFGYGGNEWAGRKATKQYGMRNNSHQVLTVVSDRLNQNETATWFADVLSANNYYPYGMPIKDHSYSMGRVHRYGAGGQEKVDEISGSGNHYTALFWEMDPRLARRWNQDPKPNPSTSNYAIFSGNPILNIDIKGDSAFRFDPDGKYVDVVDDGKGNDWSIQVVINVSMALEDKPGDLYDLLNTYKFNDPEKDVPDMKYLTKKYGNRIPLLFNWEPEDAYILMEYAGIYSEEAQSNKIQYAYRESQPNGLMDTWGFALATDLNLAGMDWDDIAQDRGGYYVYKGVDKVYNAMDFGNALWGLEMWMLGFDLGEAQSAANLNHFFMGRRNYSQAAWFDAPGDQRAIADGFTKFNMCDTDIEGDTNSTE